MCDCTEATNGTATRVQTWHCSKVQMVGAVAFENRELAFDDVCEVCAQHCVHCRRKAAAVAIHCQLINVWAIFAWIQRKTAVSTQSARLAMHCCGSERAHGSIESFSHLMAVGKVRVDVNSLLLFCLNGLLR